MATLKQPWPGAAGVYHGKLWRQLDASSRAATWLCNCRKGQNSGSRSLLNAVDNPKNIISEAQIAGSSEVQNVDAHDIKRGGSHHQTHRNTSLRPKPVLQERNPEESASRVVPSKFVAYKNVIEAGNSRLVIKSKASKPFVSKRTEEALEVVRKAVIDVLAHTDDMGEALERTLKSFGQRNSYWDQVRLHKGVYFDFCMACIVDYKFEAQTREFLSSQMMKELEVRGARRQALQVFRFLQAQPSVKLREQNFVTIISILGREGKLGLAREIFDSLKKLGIATSVHSYTGLISG